MTILEYPVHRISTELYHQRKDGKCSPVHLPCNWVDNDNDRDDSSLSGAESFQGAVCLSIVVTGPLSLTPPRVVSITRNEPVAEPCQVITALSSYVDQPIIGKLNLNFDMKFCRGTSLIKPRRIGYFSLKIDVRTNEEVYFPDKSQSRYLCLPRKNKKLYLLRQFDTGTVWSRSPSDLHILRWYMDNKNDFIIDDSLSGLVPDFITDIRTITSIMTSPYEDRNDWDIIGVKVGGKIILHEVDTPVRKNAVATQTDIQNASSYAGYNFESLITRRYNGLQCRTYYGGLRDSFHGVLVTKVGQHNIIYNARCCCVKNKAQFDKNINEMEFVEIKTRYGSRSWHSRLPALWARAVLNNINRTVVGKRDEQFQVYMNDVVPFYTNKMPSFKNRWSPKTLVDCLQSTLDFMMSQIDRPNVVYRFHHSPGEPIVCQQLNEPVEKYIPGWYK